MKSFPVSKESKISSKQCPILYLNCSVMLKARIKKPNDFWNFLSRDSKFLIPQATATQEREFRNSDPPNNKEKNSEFLLPEEYNEGFRITDPQRAQRRIQNFWSPKSTGKEFSISDPPKIQNFWSSTMTQKDSEFVWSPTKTHKGTLNL